MLTTPDYVSTTHRFTHPVEEKILGFTVKKFSRSAAGREMPSADQIWTARAMLDLTQRIYHDVFLPTFACAPPQPYMGCDASLVYDFCLDRFRAIRQDLMYYHRATADDDDEIEDKIIDMQIQFYLRVGVTWARNPKNEYKIDGKILDDEIRTCFAFGREAMPRRRRELYLLWFLPMEELAFHLPLVSSECRKLLTAYVRRDFMSWPRFGEDDDYRYALRHHYLPEMKRHVFLAVNTAVRGSLSVDAFATMMCVLLSLGRVEGGQSSLRTVLCDVYREEYREGKTKDCDAINLVKYRKLDEAMVLESILLREL